MECCKECKHMKKCMAMEPMMSCNPLPECECEPMPECAPVGGRRFIGTYSTKYNVYENCEYDICKVCACCGREYDLQQDECPMCGAPADIGIMDNNPPDDPPQFGGFGRFGRFGGFGRRRFGFFPFFPFFPFFLFRRSRRRRF